MVVSNIFIILSIICIVVILTLVYVVVNLNRKVETYEDIVENQQKLLIAIKEVVTEGSNKLKQHDTRGHYTADDDLGNYFKILLEVEETIAEYIDNITNDKT